MEDKEKIYKHFSDSEVCRFLVDAEPFISIEEAE